MERDTNQARAAWLAVWGDASSDEVTDVAVGGEAVYVGGLGRLSLAPAMPETVGAYVARFDEGGVIEWAHRVPKAVERSSVFLATAGDGAVYASGRFQAGVDFDPSEGVDRAPDEAGGYVSCFAADGAYRWTRTFRGGSGEPRIAVGKDGTIALAGTLLPPGAGPVAFAALLDAGGNELRRTTWRANQFNAPAGIAVESDGGILVCGWYSEYVGFDPPGDMPPSRGGDGFVLRLTSDGERDWIRTWGGGYDDAVTDCALGDDGTLAVVGFFSLEPTDGSFTLADGTLTTLETDGFDALLYVFDDHGAPLRMRTWGGPGRDFAAAVAAQPGGGFLVSGTADLFGLDPALDSPSPTGGPFAALLSFHSDGSGGSSVTWGSRDRAGATAVAALGHHVVVGGWFKDTLQFPDVGERTAVAFSDVFLWSREAPPSD